MKLAINDSLSQTIKSWLSSTIDSFKPRLCCEIDVIAFNDAIKIILNVLISWNQKLFLVSYEKSKAAYCLLCDISEIEEIIVHGLTDEGTVSIVNISQIGGCLFDLTLNEDEDTGYSFLAAAWGSQEESIELIKKNNKAVEIFRGN